MVKKVDKNKEDVSTKEVKNAKKTTEKDVEVKEDKDNKKAGDLDSNKVNTNNNYEVNQVLMNKLLGVYRMKRQLSIAKYSASLSGYNNNLNVKKLKKDIARELTELRKNFK